MADGEYLARHLARIGTTPFLFIGSGFSRRYLGTETWEGLLRRFCQPTGRPYEYFRSTGENDFPRIAEALAVDFHSAWWERPEFEESRRSHSANAKSRSSALKIEISRYLQSISVSPADPALQEELAILNSVVIDGIITTNWDCLLESCFPDYKVYVGQDELLFASPQSIAEIYKIHGSCTAPDSLVLTHTDYTAFNARNAYLASKLLAIFVEHPVLFMGYSLSDPNIIGILKAIAACLRSENIDKLRDRLIMVSWAPELEHEHVAQTAIVSEGWSIPITQLQVATFAPTFQVLASNERRIPARVLRFLKEHVYELVKGNDPKKQIFVEDIEAADDLSKAEVVLGVGAVGRLGNVGYQAIERVDLLRDVTLADSQYDPQQIVSKTLPRLCAGHATFIPVFRYLRGAGALGPDGSIVDASVGRRVRGKASVDRRAYESSAHRAKRDAIRAAGHGIAAMEAQHGHEYVLDHAGLLDDAQIDLEELGMFLRNHVGLLDNASDWVKQQYVKLACLYDRLRYRSDPDEPPPSE